jgi:hypothetical protein
MLASVLRGIYRGAFLMYLRLTSRPRSARLPARLKPYRQSTIISLGRAIVILYLATLLTAVISARTLAEIERSQPGLPGFEPRATPPHVAGG